MKVQSTDQFIGARVDDCEGRRIGRVVGAQAGPTRFSVDWLVLRVRWWGKRAVPADHAVGTMVGLQVSLRKTEVLASPPVPGPGLAASGDQAAVGKYYAQSSSATP